MPRTRVNWSRRTFVRAASALSLSSCLPWISLAQASEPGVTGTDPVFEAAPHDAALKFNRDGTLREFAGNTVICSLLPQCDFRDETAALGDALRASSFAQKLGILPSESYHMTIFPGANDQNRKVYGWPKDVPLDAQIANCSRTIEARARRFRMEAVLPFRVQVDVTKTLGPQRVSSLRMVPQNASEDAKLRKLRDQLADSVFLFRTPDHDSYQFHISLAYQLSPLTAAEARAHHAILQRHVPRIVKSTPVLELGDPQFCTFENMYRFEPRALLQT